MQAKKSSDLHAELYCEDVRIAVMADLVEPDSVCTEITFKGTFYRRGLFLGTKLDESVEFGEIELDKRHQRCVFPAYTSLQSVLASTASANMQNNAWISIHCQLMLCVGLE